MKRILAGSVLMMVMGLVLAGQGRSPLNPIAASQAASRPAGQAEEVRGPRLVIRDGEAGAKGVVSLESVDVVATIAAPLAETSITLVFANASERQLDGELEFPLPENAVITGYALDVPAGSGQLVDGVAIEKLRARQIFESEMRKRIDPGLVEHVRGNTFRTRVYPIEGKKTRTVRITYLNEVASSSKETVYTLPLGFADGLKSASVQVDVLDAGMDPAAVKIAGLKDLAFERRENRLRAVQKFHDVQLGGALVVTLPSGGKTNVRVASFQPPESASSIPLKAGDKIVAVNGKPPVGFIEFVDTVMSVALADPEEATQIDFVRPGVQGVLRTSFNPAPRYYFNLTTVPMLMKRDDAPLNPRSVGIIWDTSLSRANADRSAEIEMIKTLVARTEHAQLTIFDTQGRALKNFRNDAKAVSEFLQGIPCDGALRLDATVLPKKSHTFKGEFEPKDNSKPTDGPVQILEGPAFDFYLFLSDGHVTLGKPQFASAEVPVYTVCSDPKANHALLTKLAQSSGGLYFNLQTTKPDAAARALLMPRHTISITADPKEVADIYPQGAVTIESGKRVLFSGRLLVPEAKVTLKQPDEADQQIVLKRENDTGDRLIPLAWAMQRIADLSLDSDANAEALVEIGKKFSLVTPHTSLLVLETLEQYLQHGVVPPKSREEIYKQFSAAIEKREQQRGQTEEEKIARVLAAWNQRVEWWNAKYEYAANFKYKKPKAEEPAIATPASPAGSGPPAMGLAGGRPREAVTTPAPASNERSITPPTFNLTDHTKSGASGGSSGGSSGGLFGGGGGGGESGGVSGGSPARTGSELAKQGQRTPDSADAVISVKPWLPTTPYMRELKEARIDYAYNVYLVLRKKYGDIPSFYLDCGNYFAAKGKREIAIRIFTNIAQLRLDNPNLLRIAAYRLLQLEDYEDAIDLFEKVARLRPEEPQSFRDLAQSYAERGKMRYARVRNIDFAIQARLPAVEDLKHALELYNKVIMTTWERFDEIEVIALMEANALWVNIHNLAGFNIMQEAHPMQNPLDKRLIKNLDLDVRIVLTWDADNTDIDLHVIEPSGEEADYSHNRTTIGGLVSRDFTQGYGPEEYCLRKAMPGNYKIVANYFGSNAPTIQGPVTVQATVITNFGRADEKREALTLRLTERKENQEIGTVTIGVPGK